MRAIIAALLLSTAAIAADPPSNDEIETVLKASEVERAARIKVLERGIARIEPALRALREHDRELQAIVAGRGEVTDAQQVDVDTILSNSAARVAPLEKQLADAKANLARGKRGEGLPMPIFSGPFNQGAIGELPEVTIQHVLDDRQMLITAKLRVKPEEDETRSVTFLVRDVDTEGLADGLPYNFKYPQHLLKISGTHRYRSAEGPTFTVLALEPFDAQAVLRYREKKAVKRPAAGVNVR